MEIQQLVTLIQSVSDSRLTEFSYEEDGVSLHLKKEKEAAMGNVQAIPVQSIYTSVADATSGSVPEAVADVSEGHLIRSPLVGVFYMAPSEESAPFVKVGDRVKNGQTVAIVEAMKLMNEIESEYDGEITQVLVKNAEPVEFGQPLFVVK